MRSRTYTCDCLSGHCCALHNCSVEGIAGVCIVGDQISVVCTCLCVSIRPEVMNLEIEVPD